MDAEGADGVLGTVGVDEIKAGRRPALEPGVVVVRRLLVREIEEAVVVAGEENSNDGAEFLLGSISIFVCRIPRQCFKVRCSMIKFRAGVFVPYLI